MFQNQMFQSPMFQSPMFLNYEDVASFGKANLEAAMASTKALTRGLESYGQACADYARVACERGVAAAQAMAQAKSPEEAVQLQSDYARTFVDETVAQGKKLTDMCLEVANDTTAPLQARVDAAMERAGVAKAA
jgi:phasin family protein